MRVITMLAIAYDTPFDLKHETFYQDKRLILEFPQLDIKIRAVARSVRHGKRILTFKLLREYGRKIITVSGSNIRTPTFR